MKHKSFFIPLLLAIVACNNNRESAENLYNQAQQLYNIGDYEAATYMIDSISNAYPQEIETIRRGMLLQCQVNQKHYEKELIRIDSLYNNTVNEMNMLKDEFELVREGTEQTLANYVYRNTHSNKAISGSAMKAHVTEEGDFILTSIYHGSSPIEHTGISVTAPDGTTASSTSITYDGGKNYRYTSGNKNIEIVSYNLSQCSDVMQVIAATQGKMTVRYTGGKPYSLTIDAATHHIIARTYRLAQTMALSDSLLSQRQYSIMQVELADKQLIKLEERECIEVHTSN